MQSFLDLIHWVQTRTKSRSRHGSDGVVLRDASGGCGNVGTGVVMLKDWMRLSSKIDHNIGSQKLAITDALEHPKQSSHEFHLRL